MVAGILLAAGAGRRYGMPKALVRQDGRAWVSVAYDRLVAAGCDPVIVVVGAAAEEVRAELATTTVVDNPDWPSGMGSSLRAGLAAAGDTDADAAVIMLVDTPGVTADAVRRLVALAAPDALATATYQGRPGHPVLLGRDHWAGVAAAAHDDVGARDYLRTHAAQVRRVPCDDIADGRDIDTPGVPRRK